MAEENGETRRRRRRPRRRSGSKSGGHKKEGAGGEREESRADAARWGRGGRGKPRARTRGRATRGRPRPRRPRLAENWWARRWVEVLEGFQVGRRLGRGRSYARQGQVVELELGKGFVTALVQGSRDAPYLVRMRLSMLSSTDWKKVTRRITEQPELAAALVAGRIPEHIEEVFEPLGLSLFPATSGDLKTAFSCPDQANPCKHVAAVYYLLGEEFDRDPFLVFRLRGIDRNEIMEAIGGSAALRGAPVPAPAPPNPKQERPALEETGHGEDGPAAETEEEPLPREPEPLPTEPHAFWAGGGGGTPNGREVRVPPMHGALTKRLGGFSFFRGLDDCGAVIERVYRNASISGLDVYLGERDD